ncbi:alpha/beta fold hydrolase [Polymorphobacter sp.]|uniref:alpha/beta fold hydrolase n=1 Tax=Polymorphobacter sp. TaxID=1909290 RepID=UPI003F6E82B1
MTDVRKSYADTSGGQIHVRSLSADGTPVVFFHQTASSGQMWLKTMERLAGRWPLHALDTPGFGGSFDAPKDSKPSMSNYVDWLHEAILSLGIGQCHIVGHHTGACIGVELAARHPELARSLTMIGPVPLTDEERVEFSKHFGIPFAPLVSGSYLLENWEYLRNLGAHADPLLIHREMADQLRAWWGRVQSYNAVWGQDFPHYFKQVQCPIMIGAAPDDVLYPYLDRAAQMRPDARVLPLNGANFEPDLDADNFAAGLADFLTGVDRG